MTELRNQNLVESLAAALETMAFVTIAAPEESEPTIPPAGAVIVSIEFVGARNGRLELVAPRDLGLLLLDNTLSCDPSETLVMPNPGDALIELVNITCGILLKRLGTGSKCEMKVPKLRPFNVDQKWHEFVIHSDCDVLVADGSTIAIRVIEE